MNKPSTYERCHWRIFNFGAKVVGAGFAVVGGLFCLLVVAEHLGFSDTGEYPLGLLVLFVPLSVLGVLMVKAKPYYPAKYKDWYEHK